jgi:protein-disulfide isomerase
VDERTPDAGDNAAELPSRPAVSVTDADHALGPPDAPMTLVVYGDYACPYTRGVMPVIRDVRERLGDELRYAYRHFPVDGIHPHARQAAETAEAAGAQGMFWAMHDMLFTNQRELELPALIRYAHLLGLDAHRVQQELTEHRHAARVEADVTSGRASGIEGTPALFVNGARYGGIHETSVLVAALMSSGGVA